MRNVGAAIGELRWRGTAVAALVGLSLVGAGVAVGAPPSAPTIREPTTDGEIVSGADVHMEATGFADPDGDTHVCSDWEIWAVSPMELAWQAPCAGETEKLHLHMADGTFVNSYAGEVHLKSDTDYRLRVRFRDSAGETSAWSERPFRTEVAGPPGVPSPVPWGVRQPGFKVELVASGLRLPVNVAPVLRPGRRPGDPALYVTELYGKIKVVTRSGAVRNYAKGLLNFNPTGDFPGTGEQGLTGIVVDPLSGDVFASMVYEDTSAPQSPKPHYAKVVRFHSDDGGRTAATQETVLDLRESQGPSHQISNLTIGPDRKLYVHNGDGEDTARGQDLEMFGGKVLRVSLDGSPPEDNPFYDVSDGITPRDYVYAYGFRNPFGGAWRAADRSLYAVDNGLKVDRFVKLVPGRNYLWDGTDDSMRSFALYNWEPSHAPVNVAFVQPETADGSGFPARTMGHAFVAESGPTWAIGPQYKGKRIVELVPNSLGEFDARPFVEYTGVGKATVIGLAAGPDGLYFTDLYKDVGFRSAIDRGARVWRVRDTTKPILSRLALRPHVFRAARSGSSTHGGLVRYRVSERATVSGAVRRCVRASSRHRERRGCVRWMRMRGSFTHEAVDGSNRFHFTGRLQHRRLERGRYRLILRALDAAGNLSKPKKARFRVIE
jgi:glucose/arabinose dehydrogenase